MKTYKGKLSSLLGHQIHTTGISKVTEGVDMQVKKQN